MSSLAGIVYPLTVLKLFRSAVTLVNLFKIGKSEGSTSERCGIFTLPAGHITLRIPHYPIPNSLSHWVLPIFKGFCSATLLEDLSALGNSFLLWRGPCPLVAIDKTFRSTPVSNATAELELLCSVYVTLPRHPTCCTCSTSLVSLFINDCFSFRKKAYQANFTLKSQISTN